MYDLHSIRVDSTLLRGNRLGDPHERELLVLAPEGHDAAKPLPAVWMLPAFGNSQGSFLADDAWREGLPQRVSRLQAEGMPDALFVLPDLFTRYGGSQGLDSTATGPYESHLWQELRPTLEARFAVGAHGLAGHSSGGYMALAHAMRHPEIVRAAACHTGDMLFEYCYLPDFPRAAGRLQQDGGVEGFVRAWEAAPRPTDPRFATTLNVVAMAACYSPDEKEPLGIALPFEPETAELRPAVWHRWMEKDPVRMASQSGYAQALASLRLLYLDAGRRDDYQLQWGARSLARRLQQCGIPREFEEFDDGHSGTAYRFDRSLPLLVRALQATP